MLMYISGSPFFGKARYDLFFGELFCGSLSSSDFQKERRSIIAEGKTVLSSIAGLAWGRPDSNR